MDLLVPFFACLQFWISVWTLDIMWNYGTGQFCQLKVNSGEKWDYPRALRVLRHTHEREREKEGESGRTLHARPSQEYKNPQTSTLLTALDRTLFAEQYKTIMDWIMNIFYLHQSHSLNIESSTQNPISIGLAKPAVSIFLSFFQLYVEPICHVAVTSQVQKFGFSFRSQSSAWRIRWRQSCP